MVRLIAWIGAWLRDLFFLLMLGTIPLAIATLFAMLAVIFVPGQVFAADGAQPQSPAVQDSQAGIHQAVPPNAVATKPRSIRTPPRYYGGQPVAQAQVPRCRNGAALGQPCRPLTREEQQKLLMMMVLWKVSPS